MARFHRFVSGSDVLLHQDLKKIYAFCWYLHVVKYRITIFYQKDKAVPNPTSSTSTSPVSYILVKSVVQQGTCCIFIMQYINYINENVSSTIWLLADGCDSRSHHHIQAMCSKDHLYNLRKENACIIVEGLLLTKQDKSLTPFYAKFNECPPYVKCNLYKSMDCCIIEFSSPVWDSYTFLNIESIQSSAASFCLIIILGQATSVLYLHLNKRDFVARVWWCIS